MKPIKRRFTVTHRLLPLQYMRDRSGAQRPLQDPPDSHHGPLGQKGLHPHTAQAPGYAQAALRAWQAQVGQRIKTRNKSGRPQASQVICQNWRTHSISVEHKLFYGYARRERERERESLQRNDAAKKATGVAWSVMMHFSTSIFHSVSEDKISLRCKITQCVCHKIMMNMAFESLSEW